MSTARADVGVQGHDDPGHPQETFEVEDSNNPIDEIVYPTGLKLWLALSSLLMVSMTKGIDLTIVAVAVPSLTDEFKTVEDIGWYSAAGGITLSAFVFFFGKVYTVFSLKPVFLGCVVLSTLGSLLCTVARTSRSFIVGRAVIGFANSGIGNGAITILSHVVPLRKRPMWFGIIAGVQTVFMVSAPLIGGALVDSVSWRACFGINLPVGALAFFLILFGFKDASSPSIEEPLKFSEKLKRLDLLSTPVFVPCITSLLLALQWGGTRYGWNNGIVISLLAIFGTLLVVFSFMQYRAGDKATLPPKILRNRSMVAGACFQACCDGTLGVTEYHVSIYLQGVRGFSATKSGALGLPMIVGLLISGLVAGFGTSHLGYYTRKIRGFTN